MAYNLKNNNQPRQYETWIKAKIKTAQAKDINESNLTQNIIKGDGFVTYPQIAMQKYSYNAFLDIQKDLAQ